MKAAVCTKNGSKVDLHFGKTENFYIYELEKNNIAELEVRSAEKYCSGYLEPEHKLQFDKINSIFDKIKDCEVLFTAQIGTAPKAALIHKGICVIECESIINKLPELINK